MGLYKMELNILLARYMDIFAEYRRLSAIFAKLIRRMTFCRIFCHDNTEKGKCGTVFEYRSGHLGCSVSRQK